MSEPRSRLKDAPDHGPTTPVAKRKDLACFGEIEEPEENVLIVRHQSGQVSKWIESIGGYFYKVG